MTWHLDADLIDGYRTNELSAAAAASVEAHVIACASCRTALGGRADARRLDANWSALTDQIDAPRRSVFERTLVRLGLRAHIARLLVITPTLRLAWLGALMFVSALAIGAGNGSVFTVGSRGTFWFLVLAPLVPLGGVAAAFNAHNDPLSELTAAAPISAFELLLVRTAAVLLTSVPVTLLASAALPETGGDAVAWLLPALGLTTTALALARFVPLTAAAASLGGVWLLAAGVAARGGRAADLVHSYAAFGPTGQLGFVALSLLAIASIAASRRSYELRRLS